MLNDGCCSLYDVRRFFVFFLCARCYAVYGVLLVVVHRCLLFVACCLLRVVRSVSDDLFTVCCWLLSVVCGSLRAVCCLRSVVRCFLFVAS